MVENVMQIRVINMRFKFHTKLEFKKKKNIEVCYFPFFWINDTKDIFYEFK